MIFNKINSYAKINLSLNVIERLPNKYHKIESLITFVRLFDERKVRSIFRKITYYTPKSILRRFSAIYLPLFMREGIPFLGERRKWLLCVILICVYNRTFV